MIKPHEAVAALRRAPWLMRPEMQRILALLDGPAGRTRAVGGSVRDTLLQLPRTDTDVDLATELHPDEVMRRAAISGITAHPTGVDHGTVTLVLDSVLAEVTTLREDVETDGRHAVVRFGTDWRRDAERRDFTLNALYAGMDGELFDPLHGLDDCLARRVRFIGDPRQRIAEDRLRVLRFFRFSASHGDEAFDAAGLDACRAAADQLGNLAAERIGVEMRKMLGLRRIAKTLATMRELRILALGEDAIALEHSYERKARRPDYFARLALLLTTVPATALQALWRLSNDDLRTATQILAGARLIADYRLNEAAYRHPGSLTESIEVAATLADWGEAGELAVIDQLRDIQVPSFPLSGDDLIAAGMQPGRALGDELRRLEETWIAGGFRLTRDQLLADLRR